MNPKNVSRMLAELRVLPMFPNDENVLIALTRMVGLMATSEDQVRWLVNRMTSGLYAQWPGPQEMRACFCSKFKPKDGVEVHSVVYLDGIPSEKDSRGLLNAPQMKALPPGSIATRDSGLEAAFKIAAGTMRIKGSMGGPATKAEIASAPGWLRRLEGYE